MAAANGTWELTNVEGMQAFYDEISKYAFIYLFKWMFRNY